MTQESEDQKKDAALAATISPTSFTVAADAANSSLKVVGQNVASQLAHSAKQLATNTPFEIIAKAAESRTAFSAAALAAESSSTRALRELAEGNSFLKTITASQSWTESMLKAADPMRGIREHVERSLALEQINSARALARIADMQPELFKFQEQFNRPAIDTSVLDSISSFAKGIELAELQLNRQSTLKWISELQKSAIAYDERFRLPAAAKISELVANHHSAFAAIGERHRESVAAIQDSITSMNSRWLDSIRAIESSTALAALHGIGTSIERLHPFADEVSAALRVDLGNWQDQLTMPNGIGEDVILRTNFYVERGYNADLANFPEAAFREGLGISHLDADIPDLVPEYVAPTEAEDSEEEINFVRANRAHNRLFRFETRLREFIDTILTATEGDNWPKHRLPPNMFESWKEKKRKAEEDPDVPKLRLIAYADFTDYVPIICQRNNWPLFAPFFSRPENVRESMQRLYPVRLCTMHARFIQNDDELYLYAEVTRLTKAISRKKS